MRVFLVIDVIEKFSVCHMGFVSSGLFYSEC